MPKTPHEIIDAAIERHPYLCEALKETSTRIDNLSREWKSRFRANPKPVKLLEVIEMQHLITYQLLRIVTELEAKESTDG